VFSESFTGDATPGLRNLLDDAVGGDGLPTEGFPELPPLSPIHMGRDV
jgi:hypothetical protein